MKNLKFKNQFVEKAKKIHGDLYDYSEVKYITAKTKIVIICKIHGSFLQTPNNHLSKYGCSKCGKEKASKQITSNAEEFIAKAKKIFKDLYDYNESIYVNNSTKIIITCKKHGSFSSLPSNHLKGHGCPKCGIIKYSSQSKLGKEEFIKRAKLKHGNKYNYDKVIYQNKDILIIIICPKHGEFQQSPHNHVRNNAGCPTCNESKGERRIRLYLQSNKIEFASQYKFDDCRNILKLPFDFAIWDSKKNLKLIEYQGKQHYKVMEWIDKKKSEGNLDKIIQRDKIKLDWCNKNNIPLLIIPYTEFQNIEGMLDFFCII